MLRVRIAKCLWGLSAWMASMPALCRMTIALYGVTFLFVLPYLCNDWAYSVYMAKGLWGHRHLSDRAMEINDKHADAAEVYLKSLPSITSLKYYESMLEHPEVYMVIAVITIKRTKDGVTPLRYLTQVMAKLDEASKADSHFTKALFICNVFAGPGPHNEVESLSQYFPVRSRFPNGSVSATIMDVHEKEKQDYAFCMQEALKSNPRYVLMVEDDAVPSLDLFPVLHQASFRLNMRQQRWAFTKLYYPERWQGYSFEMQTFLELLGIMLLAGYVAVLMFYCLSWYSPKFLAFKESALIASAIYFALLAVCIGRPHLLELKRLSPHLYSLKPAADCCTPSILFLSEEAHSVVRFLDENTCSGNFAIDVALDTFAQQMNLKRYSVEPNLFRHIGMMSSIKGVSRNPEQFIFS